MGKHFHMKIFIYVYILTFKKTREGIYVAAIHKVRDSMQNTSVKWKEMVDERK